MFKSARNTFKEATPQAAGPLTPRRQGRGLEGLGLAQGRLGTRIWAQHGPNLSQVGANWGPAWTQFEPTWSQLGSMLGPDRLK